jgi:transcription antitermination factor NusG
MAPGFGEGMVVRIKSGPLRGVEGPVEHRQGQTTVLLRLDFIGQGAAIKIEAHLLEPT